MQFTIDGATIITGIVVGIWTIATGVAGVWLKRLAADRREMQERITRLSEKLDGFQLTVARDYASRSEVRDEREETRDLFSRIESKINDLTNHVMGIK